MAKIICEMEDSFFKMVVTGDSETSQKVTMTNKSNNVIAYETEASYIDADNMHFTFNWIVTEVKERMIKALNEFDEQFPLLLERLNQHNNSSHNGPPESSHPETIATIPFTK